MDILILFLLGPVVTTQVQGNPWLFEEIKPLTDSDTVKKSSIPDLPVKEVDPTSPTINIKEDIREDILGKNKSSSKFKEGVKKLLDFLETGPEAADDAPGKNEATPSNNGNTTRDAVKDSDELKQNNTLLISKQNKQPVTIGNHLGSLDKDGHDGSLRPEKSNSNFVTERKEPPAIPMGFVNQQKEPPAIPMRSEIHGDGDKDGHDDSLGKPEKSNSNFVTDQRKEPPAIPMGFVNQPKGSPAIPTRSEIHGNEALSYAAVTQLNGNTMRKGPPVLASYPGAGTQLDHSMAKSQIPYSPMAYNYKATRLLQNNGIARSIIPNAALTNSPQQHYNPYSAYYQRSSLPYHYGNVGGYNPYKLTQRPNTAATQALRYPYNQRRMLPIKPYNYNAALRSNVRLPYRSSTIRSPAYNPRLPYTKTFVPRSPFLVRKPMSPLKPPMSLIAAKARIPAFRYLQNPRQPLYKRIPKWNLLGRNIISKPALPSNVVKFRRMAISDRGHSYTGLESSRTRDKVAQKTPLPLPLASIMTAARIVVPARPLTLNGAFKSNVEMLPSADPEERGARAV